MCKTNTLLVYNIGVVCGEAIKTAVSSLHVMEGKTLSKEDALYITNILDFIFTSNKEEISKL